jgi:myo-inositol-1(or 4)-monophosphatase
MSEIGEYYEFAIDLAIKSGIYLSEGYKSKLDWKDTSLNTKVDQSDLVTEFDKKIEDFIFTQIKEKYPSHKYINIGIFLFES